MHQDSRVDLKKYQFSKNIDVNHLEKSIPHFEELFINLIRQGYFEKFRGGSSKAPWLINILEISSWAFSMLLFKKFLAV